jgi:elongation factor 1-gamma
MSLKIYSYPDNPRVYKALIAAQYADVNIEVPPFNFKVDNTTPEFLAKNPLGKVPVLETAEGCIFESNAIARYVARLNNGAGLFGSTDYEAGLVDQWIDFSVGEVDLPAAVWLYPIYGLIENNPKATNTAKADIRKVLEILNKHLLDRTFLVGERVTLADIVLTACLYPLYTNVLDVGFRKPFQNVNRWFLTCVNQVQFKNVLGTVTLVEKAKVAPAPAKSAEPKQEKKQEKSEKQEKPQVKKEKVEKPPADEDDEDKASKKEKPKNPLDELPPTSLDLDAWKRFYFANPREKSMPYFWENLDRQGWSVWFGDYLYNNELNKLFMVCNLVGGFIQRLDPLRKYGFGSIVILGEEPNLEIKSVWLFRGQEVPFEMKDCPDSETYAWRKADLDDPEQKQVIEDLLCWEGPTYEKWGMKVKEGKVFR